MLRYAILCAALCAGLMAPLWARAQEATGGSPEVFIGEPPQPSAYYTSGRLSDDGPAPAVACEVCQPAEDPCVACEEEEEGPVRLFCQDNCSGITVGGWLSAGITENNHGFTDNGPVPFTSTDEFYLNQAWIYAEKVATTDGCGTDWGFRIDYVFGADGPDTQAFGDEGWDFGWNSSQQYGSAIPQLYFEYAINDLSFKIGHFYTIIGYEVVGATGNFFYSHAYTMNYGEPFTHTGVLATYKLSDDISCNFGYVSGWDAGFENRFDADTFLGGLTLTLTEDTTLIWACNAGNFGDGNPNNAGNIYMQSIVLTHQLNECWEYVFQSDYGANTGLGAANSEWYGVNQYLFRKINDCWKIGGRFEWFDDDDGARVGFAPAPVAGDWYALTLGANYTPNANVTIRPEIRFDWMEANAAGGAQPFNGGLDNDQTTFAVDFVIQY